MINVYILLCADGSYYTGSTRLGLEARIGAHSTGHYGGYTASRLPVTLVWSQEFQRITDAIATERQIKGATPSRGDFDPNSRLAKRSSKKR
jgi:putative endonuclease